MLTAGQWDGFLLRYIQAIDIDTSLLCHQEIDSLPICTPLWDVRAGHTVSCKSSYSGMIIDICRQVFDVPSHTRNQVEVGIATTFSAYILRTHDDSLAVIR